MTTTAIVLICLFVVILVSLRGNRKSPKGSANAKSGDLEVEVIYCRPFVRNRKIFGAKEEGALLPYGKHWRLGANQATTIRFSHGVKFGGQGVPAGIYHLYAVPGKTEFEIGLNKKIPMWGSMVPKTETDVCRIKVPALHNAEIVEQLTIEFEQEGGLKLRIVWAEVRLEITVVKA